MFEIELFYRMCEAAIREEHAAYLKAQKRIPLAPPLPTVDPLPVGNEWKKLGWFMRWRLKRRYKRQVAARRLAERRPYVSVEDKLLKGYNAGMEAALRVLTSKYKDFMQRLKDEEKESSRY